MIIFIFYHPNQLKIFAQIINPYTGNEDKCQNLAKYDFPNKAIQYCGYNILKFLQECRITSRPIAFVLHINFIELSKINRILRHLTEANRMKFEVFVA